MCVCGVGGWVGVCVYMCVNANKGWEQVSDHIELEVEMA